MERPFDRVAVLVLDGVGCGEAEDTKAEFAHDVGANSLLHAATRQALTATGLNELGLPYIPGLEGLDIGGAHPTREQLRGAFGALRPTHAGNGSPEGHEALMGLKVTDPFLYFTDTGIPDEVVRGIEAVAAEVIGREVQAVQFPGTDNISGTNFIEHPNVGVPIYESRIPTGPARIGVYTSSDSLVQIAMHQTATSQELIRRVGQAVRERVLVGQYGRVGRVIMRPFKGEPGQFKRVDSDRVDFSLNPDGPTLIDFLAEAGVPVNGLGKAGEMFNDQGFPHGSVEKMDSDDARLAAAMSWITNPAKWGLLLTNLKNTDEKYGHRRLPVEYIQHIVRVAAYVASMKARMTERDLLVITSDHGNDPTHMVCTDDPAREHTNHTRENVPFLAFSPRMKGPIELGLRNTFEDVAATIGENFGVAQRLGSGESFLPQLLAA